MTWGVLFRLRQQLKGSLWVVPAIGVLLGLVAGWVSLAVDDVIGDDSLWTYTVPTATAVLTAIISAMAALTGFVVTVAVLAVQMATGTFSARYMRLWYRDAMLKGLLALLIGTLTFSFVASRSIGSTFVPDLTVTIASTAVIISLLVFVVFLDRFLHRLRPVAVAAYVAEAGRRSFDAWLQLIGGPDGVLRPLPVAPPAGEPRLVVRARAAGCLQSVDAHGLASFARRHECTIVFSHAIGDFIPCDARMLAVYGSGLPPLAGERLSAMVALGAERTIEQDPAFAVRVMVDIADRALSPAVNDPTTAVQVLDHLSETLRMIGTAEAVGGAREDDSPAGWRPGVLIPLRSWEEYLELSITEIRDYGAGSIQVMRRLRFLLSELCDLVPPGRQAAVREQLRRLDATVQRSFRTSEDADLASAADAQGIGGPASSSRTPHLDGLAGPAGRR